MTFLAAGLLSQAPGIAPGADAPPPASPAPVPLELMLRELRRKMLLQEADSGLLFRLLQAGSGPRPQKHDAVLVSYTVAHGLTQKPLSELSAQHVRIRVADLIPGMAEGVQMLTLDGAVLLLVPPDLCSAGGSQPAAVPPETPLLITLQLHEIIPAPVTL